MRSDQAITGSQNSDIIHFRLSSRWDILGNLKIKGDNQKKRLGENKRNMA